MPKIRCLCDAVISLSEIPCPNQFMIISDVEYGKFTDQVDAEEVYMAMEIAVRCPACGRLHIFWDGFANPQVIYKPEDY